MSSFFRWAVREMRLGMGRAALSGPEQQESLDLLRALDFVSARALPSSAASSSSSSSSLAAAALDRSSLSLPKQRELVHAEILAQITHMLRAVAEANASEPSRRRLKRLHSDGAAVSDPKLFPLNTAAHGRGAHDVEVASDEYLEELRRLLGFSIRCAASGAPDAGRGVWLGGAAPMGSVVAIFPGVVYLPGHLLRTEGTLEALEPDDHLFLFSRYDGVLLDGRDATPSPLSPSEVRERRQRHFELKGRQPLPSPWSPFGLGHLCNHPPPGVQPNVVALGFDFPSRNFSASSDAFPEELLPMVPSIYDAAPSMLTGTYSPGVAMHSVVLMTSREVADEELFLDYRLSPDIRRPSWYHSPDEEEELRRWSSQPPER